MNVDVGDRVRIDIPDENDQDHDLHGRHGKITNVISDDASDVTGNPVDDNLYRVTLDDGRDVDVRERDLRPAISSPGEMRGFAAARGEATEGGEQTATEMLREERERDKTKLDEKHGLSETDK